MIDDNRPKSRGRPRRSEAADPTGYRATDARRRHMDLARAFLGLRSQQALIDRAVHEFLLAQRQANPLYAQAAEALDLVLAEGDNVSQLDPRRRELSNRSRPGSPTEP